MTKGGPGSGKKGHKTYLEEFFEKPTKQHEEERQVRLAQKKKDIQQAEKILSWNSKKDWPKVQAYAKKVGKNPMTVFSEAQYKVKMSKKAK